MLSSEHEFFVEAIRQVPDLPARFVSSDRGANPFHDRLVLESPDLTHTVPVELRADAVTVLYDGDRPVLGIICEVQLRKDRRKWRSWARYVMSMMMRLDCPVQLVVFTTSVAVAQWAAAPIAHHGALLGVPVVVGPDQIPVITDPAVAREDPEMAMLSAVTHSEVPGVLEAVLHALRPDFDNSGLYADLIYGALPAAARKHLEDLVTSTYEYKMPFARKYFAEGKAEGKAEDVLAVLAARGIDVPEDVRARVAECTDGEQLDIWLIRAVTATTLGEVFD